jgi:hypothetical protein
MVAKPLKKNATYDDLREVPDHFVAEMFDGDLWAFPRPALPHANAAGSLFGEVYKAFHRKDPGGWVLLFEPELHFGRDVLVPDIAGWRRKRLPNVPADAYLTLAPDWIHRHRHDHRRTRRRDWSGASKLAYPAHRGAPRRIGRSAIARCVSVDETPAMGAVATLLR